MADDRKARGQQPSAMKPMDQLRLFKRWWELDRAHSAAWRRQAKDDFAFVAGDGQWTSEERQALQDDNRVPITFNRTLTLIEAVSGIEINGRHETTFLPRGTTPGVVQKNELLSATSQWMDDESNADTAQSRAFQDSVKVGMGWTEASLSYDEEPDGAYVEKRTDPLEMWWDYKAREPNLSDARRIWHVRADIDIDEARAMFPEASDDDLDATWCHPGGAGEAKAVEDRRRREENAEGVEEQTVTIARIQWIEYEQVFRAVVGEKVAVLTKQERDAAEQIALSQGLPFRAIPQRRKVYKQAFIGDRVLSESFDPPCDGHFTFNCVTGKAHEVKGTWYGLVELVRDPQKWANKWLTQSLHILNATAKGGILAEEDAFVDQRDAEDTYARPDAITWVTKGAIANQKIMPKPGAGLPNGHMELMQFALTAIRDASGINLEILGLREATQPGVLEAQRKQAGMTILATLFDSLRGFRKRVGKVRLYFIQEYLADGRLVRIAGPEGQEYVPLVRDKIGGRFDVIVEDAPTSPNQREQTWAQLQPIMAIFKDMMTPEVAVALLEFSPLPTSVVEKIKAIATESAQKAQQDPEAQEQKQLAKRSALAKVAVDEATAADKRASAQSKGVDASVKVADAERERQQPPRGVLADEMAG